MSCCDFELNSCHLLLLHNMQAFCRPSEVKCPLQVLLDTVLVPFSLLAAAADALLRTVSALLQRNTGSGTTFSSSIATSPRLIAISNLAATPSLMLAANSSSGSSNGSGGGGGGDGGGSSSLLAAGSSPVSDLPAVYQPLRTLLLLGHCSMLDVRWVDATGDHFATVTAADFKLDNGRVRACMCCVCVGVCCVGVCVDSFVIDIACQTRATNGHKGNLQQVVPWATR